ncbi:DMT family transporter [Streptomyces sp. RS10V-4]|uniref:DMT family transporter n=1 Tax=Streptomyces rhizoryzae TaxID=2932493 RepID=UPI002002FF2B|nr:DMT family transporter [Streptomyces rhizoryzae]MCK7624407.1 DMT family transporter [Streptomyces rhizoryzae]
MLSVLLAVLAAFANGLASVLQRRAARGRPGEESLNWRLIWHLLHTPVWIGGVASVIVAFLLQAVALAYGRISVVEPVLVLDLPAALVLSALIFHSRLRAREWGAVAVMAAGLAGLLLSLSPSEGSATGVAGPVWAFALAANLLLVAVGVGWAATLGRGARKAAILGTTSGCGFGLTAALMKGMTGQSSHGIADVFTTWQLYAMIVAGAGSMFLLQSAVHAGRLLAAQPGLSMADPVVSILWGVLVFGEKVRGGIFIVLSLAAIGAVTAGVLVLAHSPLLAGEAGRDETREEA